MVYGSLSIKGTGSDARAIVTEDANGPAGSSDLVMSVFVPAVGFTILDPKQIQVGLGIHSSPAMTRAFRGVLDDTSTVFSAKLSDRKHVHVLAESPYFPRPIDIPEVTSPTTTREDISVNVPNLTIATLTAKGEVQTQQASPCVMKVTIGKVTKLLVYPVPINGNDPKLAIARKSRWLQVCAYCNS
jgi:hypothetical protein